MLFQNEHPGEEVYNRGIRHWKMQNLEQTISDLKQSIEIEPYNMRYWAALLQALTEAGRYEEAKMSEY